MNASEAAATVIDTIIAMAGERRPLMVRVLPDGEPHFWDHYPDDDARDSRTRSRWYYHVHAPGDRDADEHGHFHLFLHRTQIDPQARPIAEPREGEKALAHMAHVAGLSINHAGIPTTWFMTNRWVTDEFLYPADVVTRHLELFDVDETPEDPLVNRFLTAMVALYRDELSALLVQRDDRLRALHSEQGPAGFESGSAVLACLPIDLDEKIASLGLT